MAWADRNLFSKRFNLSLNQEDAYVSGYFGIRFQFASVLNDILKTGKISAGGFDFKDVQQADLMLAALCEGVTTVPGGTLNVVDMTAMGGVKWGAPGSIDHGDQITLKFREMSGMPIKKFITAWTNLIRNTNTGLSELHTDGAAGTSTNYTKKNFSSDLVYWTTKPNGRDVEFAVKMTGVYSMSDLSSQIATDIATVDGQTFDVNFHVDDLYWDTHTMQEAQGLIEEYHSKGTNEYYNWNGIPK